MASNQTFQIPASTLYLKYCPYEPWRQQIPKDHLMWHGYIPASTSNLFGWTTPTEAYEDIIWQDRDPAELVYIIVGPDEYVFHVDKAFICVASSFFETCFKDNTFQEGNDGRVVLKEEDPLTFSTILMLLATNQKDWIRCVALMDQWFNLYRLADKLMMIKLKNNFLDAIRKEVLEWWVNPGGYVREFMERNRKEDSLLGQYFMDLCVYGLWSEDLTFEYDDDDQELEAIFDEESGYPRCIQKFFRDGGDLAAALVERLLRRVQPGYNVHHGTLFSGCRYHDHSDGSKCEPLSEAESENSSESEIDDEMEDDEDPVEG